MRRRLYVWSCFPDGWAFWTRQVFVASARTQTQRTALLLNVELLWQVQAANLLAHSERLRNTAPTALGAHTGGIAPCLRRRSGRPPLWMTCNESCWETLKLSQLTKMPAEVGEGSVFVVTWFLFCCTSIATSETEQMGRKHSGVKLGLKIMSDFLFSYQSFCFFFFFSKN